MQATLATSVTLTGIGLHSGRPVRMTLCPAPVGHGIVFRRRDAGDVRLPALWSDVRQEPLNTRLGLGEVTVATIEHLMAALAGTGLVNVRVDLDGPEVPALDGSSAEFVRAILRAGIAPQDAPREAIVVRRPVVVRQGEAVARLDPAEGMVIDFTIDFAEAAIGRQHRRLDMANGAFLRMLCDSRTFCRKSDVDAMQAAGLGLGGSLSNAVVVEGDRVLTPGGLRHADEAVRHKMLDALGDLATAGAPLFARYTGLRAGHALTNALLRALFADPANYERIVCDDARARRLPGVALGPGDLAAVA